MAMPRVTGGSWWLGASSRGAVALTPKQRRRRWRQAIIVLDLAGLVLALWTSSRYIENRSTRGYIVVLGTVALFLWALCLTWRFRSPLRHNASVPVVIAPVFAATATFGLAVALGALHPTDGTVAFVIVWVAWLLAVRVGTRRRSPRLRALLACPSDGWREFVRLRGLEMIHSNTPPQDFAFDIAVMEPLTHYTAEWQRWFVHADLAGVHIVGAPTFIESVTGKISTAELSGVWAPHVFPGDRSSAYAPWKRLLDVLVTLLLLPLLALLSLAVAVVLLVSSGRPLLFTQHRVGRGGVPFRIVKFRTMARSVDGEVPAFAEARDPRVTRLGLVIRRLRLDELPQFWNVLRGEMSIIGPRPEQLSFAETYSRQIPLYDIRHHVRPGISGWAQVRHGYTSGPEATQEKLRCDLYYIKHYSLAMDFRIAVRTIQTIVTGFGAR